MADMTSTREREKEREKERERVECGKYRGNEGCDVVRCFSLQMSNGNNS